MKHNLKDIILILGLLLIYCIAQSQQIAILDKVVATVGNEYVLFSDVEGEFAYAKERDPSLEEKGKCSILDGLIAQNLIIHQAKLDSIEVTTEEVEGSLDARFDNMPLILETTNADIWSQEIKQLKQWAI